jgi:NAD-dependent deacetylase
VAQSLPDLVCLREALRAATSVVVLTGAGISAESGVPTFRGAGGLWRNYSPQQLATPEAFARNPRLVWEWYDWRRSVIHRAQPNTGHRALAELERRIVAARGCFTLVTQNVDGLHQRAGSRNVLKLHGDIWVVRCSDCGLAECNEEVPLKQLPPHCSCGGILRPGVVWFGEGLPAEEWERASEASVRAQIVMVVGTSAAVYPAAGLAELGRGAGAKLAIINPESTPLDALADWALNAKAGEILPGLV